MLTANDISVRYGNALAVAEASFDVGDREVVAVVGANGAGKSSLGKAICGLVKHSGSVHLDGTDLSGTRAEARVPAGLVYVPEGRRVFPQLSVEDNLRSGGFVQRRSHKWTERIETLYHRVPQLRERAQVKAVLLSGGEQQLLAICRALMAWPKVLVLDEPSLGLSPRAIDTVVDLLRELVTAEDLSVVVLEQNVTFASRTADRAWAMHLGRLTTALSRAEIADPEHVRDVLSGTH
jgi:branched-chain amino acid transport system ATP-binding protein